MQSHDKIKEYVKMVCEQIRWKKAHPAIMEEIKNHIIDQRDAYLSEGMGEDDATDNAIADTGDPIQIGEQLDSTHRPKPQWAMLALTGGLLLLGIIIQVLTPLDKNYPWSLSRLLITTAIGIAFMLITYFSDFTFIGKHPKAVYFAIIWASILSLLSSQRINGQMVVMGIKDLPFSYITLLYPITFAAFIYANRSKKYIGIIFCGVAYSVPAVLALSVSVSAFALFTLCGIALLSIAIIKNWFDVNKIFGFFLMVFPMEVMAGLVLLRLKSFAWLRISAIINPYNDPAGLGYLSLATRVSLSGSKLIGRGELPSGYTVYPLPIMADSMLTSLIFNYGWIVFFVLLGILTAFIVRGFMLCLRQKSALGLFVSSAVMLTFTMQTAGYIISNLGFRFSTPISLPLISYGNGATIINMGLIGLMLSVFRTGDIVKERKMPHGSNRLLS